jgi:hypothetical protein
MGAHVIDETEVQAADTRAPREVTPKAMIMFLVMIMLFAEVVMGK